MNKKAFILLPAMMMILASCGGNTASDSGSNGGKTTTGGDTSTSSVTPSTDWVTNPVAGKKYHFGVNTKDSTLGSNYYCKGELSGYYGKMVTDPSQADAFELVEVSGGYNIKITKSDNSIVYLNLLVSGTYINVKFEATATTVFTFNSTYSTMVTTADGNEYYAGTYYGTKAGKIFDTLSYSKTSYLSEEKLDTSSFPARFYEI